MTATDRLAEIKARTEAATERRRDSFKPVFISQTEQDRERLLAALEAVLELHQPREIQVMTEDDCLSDECGHPDMDDCPVGPLDRCAGCVGYMAHPCPTVMIINVALGGTK